MSTQHLFERQGFGPGPYRLVGHNPECTVQSKARAAGADLGLWPGPDQAAGTCDSCGQGISDVYTLRSSSGVEFDVGSTCVEKASRSSGGLDPVVKTIRRNKAKAAKARESMRISSMRERLDSDGALIAALRDIEHPRFAGQTMLDSVLWMFDHAGHAGQIKTVRQIEKLVGVK